jgi:hypothetical protein
MTIYLYMKTHNKTGLKYLGKTIRDPFVYKGSGTIWLSHIKKHGYDITTEILKICETNEEIKEWGLYYSELWNIVNDRDERGNKTWANLKPEEGTGFASGELNPSKRPDLRKERSERCSGKNNPGTKEKNKRYGDRNNSKRKDVIEKLSGNNHYMKRGNWDKNKHNSKNPIVIAKKSGDNHWTKKPNYNPEKRPGYDFTIYSFEHMESGNIVHMTKQRFRHEYKLNSGSVSKLASGKVKTCCGWRLVN